MYTWSIRVDVVGVMRVDYATPSESTLVKIPHCWKSHVATNLCNSGREYHEDHYCEKSLKRRRFRLKIILIYSPEGSFVRPSGTICAILVESILRIISLK